MRFKYYFMDNGQEIIIDKHLTIGELERILKNDFKGRRIKAVVDTHPDTK